MHRTLAVLILASLVTAADAAPGITLDPLPHIGRYSVASSADGHTAWRIDSATGNMSYCVAANVSMNASCSPWMR